jgi:formamidopyrimidine-DNA glycosylase
MPELPEVEIVVRGLRETVVGKTITRVELDAPPATTLVGESLRPQTFQQILTGRTFDRVDRRGKNILISLSGNVTLWGHLKMTGHFYYLPTDTPKLKHDLMTLSLSPAEKGTRWILRFNDYRRFGRLRLFRTDEVMQQKGLVELGPEPLEITADEFVKLLQRSRRQVKAGLLDQSFIVGIGNIYADESLWAARIHPLRITSSLSRRKLIELHGHIKRLLRKSIRNMGTSVDSYAGVDGQPGGYQKYLLAYGREGEPCERCGARIKRQKIGSRSAHFCPRCQREK